MTQAVSATRLRYRMRIVLGIVGLCGGLVASFGTAYGAVAGQTPSADANHKIDDTWQGTLHVPQAGRDLRIVVKVRKDDKGALQVSNYSIDQGGAEMKADSASFEDGVFKFGIQAIDGKYEGKMAGDGKSIAGTWTQGPGSLPLVFERATPETEWVIPTPPPRLPPMAADANPSFEVATIKPSQPDRQGKGYRVRGARL